MNANPRTASLPLIAVVCDRNGDAASAVQAYLQSPNIADAAWFGPRDLDDLDRAVRDGRVRRVIFPRLADMLEGLWNEEIDAAAWLAAGVQIDLADCPAGACPPTLLKSWQRWRTARRGRRAIAGLVLSVIALAAAFTLTWLAH